MSDTIGPAGALLRVDKSSGPTSHDIVARVRRTLGIRRVGHTGTLDPFATGLMIVCVGPATRLAEFVSGRSKTYEAVLRLGAETDTLDPEGDVVMRDDAWRGLVPEDLEEAADTLRGVIQQQPPIFSAKKVDGERAYKRARRGESVDLKTVEVDIELLEITHVALPEVRFRVRCSSGTYVRVLGRDLARAVNTVGHLTALRRTAIGDVGVAGAVDADRLDGPDSIPESAWLTPVAALADLGRVEVNADQAGRLRQGQALSLEELAVGRAPESPGWSERPVVVTQADGLVAVARCETGWLRPSKVFPA